MLFKRIYFAVFSVSQCHRGQPFDFMLLRWEHLASCLIPVVISCVCGHHTSSSLTTRHSDIYQDSNQVLFKMCPGLKDVPCDRTVHMGQSDDPRCPLHLTLPPPMYQPEQEPPPQEQLTTASRDMYLSAAELQPTESLPLEFSDVRRHYVPRSFPSNL